MNPLSAAYATLASLRNRLYDTGLFSGRLQGPVVSVGSLSAGGAGKTPFVVLLGRLLQQRAIPFDVLSRGYGRRTRGSLAVNPKGHPAEYGDEPLLIARALQVPVVVGEDRFLAGQLAEQMFGPQLHLLDDGFQHRGLERDFDIVLLTARDVHDRLFPLGRLREPLGSLARAHAIVLMDDEMDLPAPPYKLVWQARRGIRMGDTPPRQVAFCGIARPQRFFRELREAGLEPLAEVVFPDHHLYSADDVRKLQRFGEQLHATGFVTTEKDLINLDALTGGLQPLHVVAVKMELEDAETMVDALLAEIDARVTSPA